MTKSTITREQAQKIIVAADEVITALAGNNEDVHPDDSKKMCELWDDLNDRYAPPVVVKELARMALAAMDSEPAAPVAEVVSIYGDLEVFGEREIRPLVGIQQMPYGTKLYRHVQPAPVVPEEATPDSIEILASARRRDHAVFQWNEDQRNAAADSWNACRAAMLQASPVCTCPSGDGSLRWPCPVHPGSSPENPGCWCRTCRPVDINDMRFVVCPDCGNKRCPRANDHRNACTDSNEPGQEGSAYPAAPQEVKHG